MAVRAPRACMTTDGMCRAVREWLGNLPAAAELCSSGSANHRSSRRRLSGHDSEKTGSRRRGAFRLLPEKTSTAAVPPLSSALPARGIPRPLSEHGLDRAPRQLLLLGRPDRGFPQPQGRRERDRGVQAQGVRVRGTQESAISLRVNQAVACTGQTLLHRFYSKRSLKKFDIERVAAMGVPRVQARGAAAEGAGRHQRVPPGARRRARRELRAAAGGPGTPEPPRRDVRGAEA